MTQKSISLQQGRNETKGKISYVTKIPHVSALGTLSVHLLLVIIHPSEFPCWQFDECNTIWIGEFFSIINQILKGVKDGAILILFSILHHTTFTQLKMWDTSTMRSVTQICKLARSQKTLLQKNILNILNKYQKPIKWSKRIYLVVSVSSTTSCRARLMVNQLLLVSCKTQHGVQ